MSYRLKQLLARDQNFRQFSRKAEQLAAVQRNYETVAPPSLVRNSHVLSLERHTLVLAAHNGATAAKLRQMTPEIISLFEAMGCEVTGIQIKVQVTTLPPVGRPKPRILGSAAKNALGKLDEKLADSPLKAALQRLLQKN